ncbi:hypothetical protein D3C80_1995950 [compost metagenome]
MAQHRMHHGPDVVRRDEVLPLQPGVGPGTAVQADSAPGAGANGNPAAEVGIVVGGMAGGVDQVDQVAVDGR